MARPTHKTIQDEAWDAAANDNFDIAFTTPLPPARYADVPSLPDANDYDGCVAEVDNIGLYISENGVWRPIPRQGTAVADLGVPIVTTSFADCDTNFTAIETKLNALLAVMRTADHIET